MSQHELDQNKLSPKELQTLEAKNEEEIKSESSLSQEVVKTVEIGNEKQMRKYVIDSGLRDVVHEMLTPLIRTQIQTHQEVNPIIQGFIKAVDDVRQMREMHDSQTEKLAATILELEQIPGILDRIKDLEDAQKNDKRTQKTMNDNLIDRIQTIRDKTNEAIRDMHRIEGELSMRDSKIKANQEQTERFKEQVTGEITSFISKMTQQLDQFSLKSNKVEKNLVKMENFYISSKSAIEDFTKQLRETKKAGESIYSFLTSDHNTLKDRISALEAIHRAHDISVNDIYTQLKLQQLQIDEGRMRIEQLEIFDDKTLPLMINLHVSDYMQEFLSAPDRLKLIEFDNKKLFELSTYFNEVYDPPGEGNPFDNKSIQSHPAFSNVSKITFEQKHFIKRLNKRFAGLFQTLSENESGFGRFVYGKDWSRYHDEQKTQDLDEYYMTRQEDNVTYLKDQMERITQNELLLRKHRETILEKYGYSNFNLDDFTLRTPESLHDNPFMRFIGFHYPVRVYKDLVFVRKQKFAKQGKPTRQHQYYRKSYQRRASSNYSSNDDIFENNELFSKLLQSSHLIQQRISINGVEGVGGGMLNPEKLLALNEEDEDVMSSYNIYDNDFSSNEGDLQQEQLSSSPKKNSTAPDHSRQRSVGSAINATQEKVEGPSFVKQKTVQASRPRKKAMTKVLQVDDVNQAMKKTADRNNSDGNINDNLLLEAIFTSKGIPKQ